MAYLDDSCVNLSFVFVGQILYILLFYTLKEI